MHVSALCAVVLVLLACACTANAAASKGRVAFLTDAASGDEGWAALLRQDGWTVTRYRTVYNTTTSNVLTATQRNELNTLFDLIVMGAGIVSGNYQSDDYHAYVTTPIIAFEVALLPSNRWNLFNTLLTIPNTSPGNRFLMNATLPNDPVWTDVPLDSYKSVQLQTIDTTCIDWTGSTPATVLARHSANGRPVLLRWDAGQQLSLHRPQTTAHMLWTYASTDNNCSVLTQAGRQMFLNMAAYSFPGKVSFSSAAAIRLQTQGNSITQGTFTIDFTRRTRRSVNVTFALPSSVTLVGGVGPSGASIIVPQGVTQHTVTVQSKSSAAAAANITARISVGSRDPNYGNPTVKPSGFVSVTVIAPGTIQPALTSIPLRVLGQLNYTLKISLSRAPTAAVSFSVTPSSNVRIVGSPTSLSYGVGQQDAFLTLYAVGVASATESLIFGAASSSDLYFSGVSPLGPVTVVIDGTFTLDTTALTVATAGGATRQFKLRSSQVTSASVSIPFTATGGVTLSPSAAGALTFASGASELVVTVGGGSGSGSFSVTFGTSLSSASIWGGIPVSVAGAVAVTVVDQGTFTVSPAAQEIVGVYTGPGGNQGSVSISIAPLTASQSISFAVNAPGHLTALSATLVINPGASSGSVTLRGASIGNLGNVTFGPASSADPRFDTLAVRQQARVEVVAFGTLSFTVTTLAAVTGSSRVIAVQASPVPRQAVQFTVSAPPGTSVLSGVTVTYPAGQSSASFTLLCNSVTAAATLSAGSSTSSDARFVGLDFTNSMSVTVVPPGVLSLLPATLQIGAGGRAKRQVTLRAVPSPTATTTFFITPGGGITVVGGQSVQLAAGQSELNVTLSGGAAGTGLAVTFGAASSADYLFDGQSPPALQVDVLAQGALTATVSGSTLGAAPSGLSRLLSVQANPAPAAGKPVEVMLQLPALAALASGQSALVTLSAAQALDQRNVEASSATTGAAGPSDITFSVKSADARYDEATVSPVSLSVVARGTIGWSRSGVVAMAAGRNTTLQLQLSAAASSPVSLVLSPPASLGVAEGNRVTVQPGAMSASVTLYPRVANAAAAAVTAQPATSNDPVFHGAVASSLSVSVTTVTPGTITPGSASISVVRNTNTTITFTLSQAATASVRIVASPPGLCRIVGGNVIVIPAAAMSHSIVLSSGSAVAAAAALSFGAAQSNDIIFDTVVAGSLSVEVTAGGNGGTQTAATVSVQVRRDPNIVNGADYAVFVASFLNDVASVVGLPVRRLAMVSMVRFSDSTQVSTVTFAFLPDASDPTPLSVYVQRFLDQWNKLKDAPVTSSLHNGTSTRDIVTSPSDGVTTPATNSSALLLSCTAGAGGASQCVEPSQDCGNNNGGCRDGRACSIEAGLRVCGPCGEESESFLDGCRSAPSWKVTSGLIAGILAALASLGVFVGLIVVLWKKHLRMERGGGKKAGKPALELSRA